MHLILDKCLASEKKLLFCFFFSKIYWSPFISKALSECREFFIYNIFSFVDAFVLIENKLIISIKTTDKYKKKSPSRVYFSSSKRFWLAQQNTAIVSGVFRSIRFMKIEKQKFPAVTNLWKNSENDTMIILNNHPYLQSQSSSIFSIW